MNQSSSGLLFLLSVSVGVAMIGLGIGPVLGGTIRDHFGMNAAFYAMGVLALLTCILVMIFIPSDYQRYESGDSQKISSIRKIWFFSQLVVERLVDFQCKIAYIMKSIGFALNDFNFVVYSFQLTGVDGVITVVDDSVTVPL